MEEEAEAGGEIAISVVVFVIIVLVLTVVIGASKAPLCGCHYHPCCIGGMSVVAWGNRSRWMLVLMRLGENIRGYCPDLKDVEE